MARYQFGPFELDTEIEELRKFGTRIRIQKQPFQVLRTLVERAGTVVSREDLRQAIWVSTTFVDFEHGLNSAMNKVRQALGDSADQAHYIETIPGQGYRFVALAQKQSSQTIVPKVGQAFSLSGLPPQAPRNAKRWKIIVPAAAALLATVAAGTLNFHRTPKLTDKDTIVLADFINTTGDSVFDGTLRQGLAIELEQSPFLSLLSEARVQKALRLMGQSGDAPLTPEVAKEICERTASAAVLDGSIAILGSKYILGLRAKDCRTGNVLYQEQVQAVRKEDVLNALSRIAGKFRTRVGESLITVEKYSTPIVEATTPSLEAFKAYSTARRFHASNGAAAMPLFRQAIEMDPKFAMAYAFLGHTYGEMGESDLSAQTITKAYRLRDRTSEAEKFFIDVAYDLRVTGNLEKLQQTCDAWAQAYPREGKAHSFLTHVYQMNGKYETAVEEIRKTLELDPDVAIANDVLAFNYENLGLLDEAEKTIQRATQRKLDIPDFLERRHNIAFLRGDKAGMEREVALSRGKSGAEDMLSDKEAFALAYSGHLQLARRMSQRAVDLARQTGHRERAASYQIGAALQEAFFRNADAAKRSAKAALELSSDREVEYGAAFALALAGDSSEPLRLANDLSSRFSEDTSARFSYLPALRALLALNRGEPLKAIELLQVAAPYDLGMPRCAYHGFFGAMYPVYIRGQAFLTLRQGAEAAVEFQKILAHPGVVVSDPIGALAHLQLGRAYKLSGDTAKARIAYQDFLTLWKDADPDIPILKQAKAEYAGL
jgi:DNA-binding winged helix-turn-helix (wHTH) protein/tetratricopeptide (TPR) repeat protein